MFAQALQTVGTSSSGAMSFNFGSNAAVVFLQLQHRQFIHAV